MQAEEKYGYEEGHFMTLQILRTFDPPVIFEVYWDYITHDPKVYSFKTTIYSGKSGYEWGKKEIEVMRKLTEQEFQKLSILIRQAQELPVDDDFSAKDGSRWYLEVNAQNRYYKIGIQSPGSQSTKRGSGNLVKLGQHLISLSGQAKEVGHVY
jgi:hypothetical protein